MSSIKAFLSRKVQLDEENAPRDYAMLLGSLVLVIVSAAALLDLNGVFSSVGIRVMALLAGG